MESVFASLLGMIFLEETLDWVQWLGCGLILAAMLLAQWTSISAERKKKAA